MAGIDSQLSPPVPVPTFNLRFVYVLSFNSSVNAKLGSRLFESITNALVSFIYIWMWETCTRVTLSYLFVDFETLYILVKRFYETIPFRKVQETFAEKLFLIVVYYWSWDSISGVIFSLRRFEVWIWYFREGFSNKPYGSFREWWAGEAAGRNYCPVIA